MKNKTGFFGQEVEDYIKLTKILKYTYFLKGQERVSVIENMSCMRSLISIILSKDLPF